LLSKWPIRVKLLAGLGLLVLLVGILAGSGLYTTYAYRGLAKSVSWRVAELPVAADLVRDVGSLRITLSELRGLRNANLPWADHDDAPIRVRMICDDFRNQLVQVEDTLADYRGRLGDELQTGTRMADNRQERQTVQQIEAALAAVHRLNDSQNWMLDDVKVEQLDARLRDLQALAAELPSYLHEKLASFRGEVRGQYRPLVGGTLISSHSSSPPI